MSAGALPSFMSFMARAPTPARAAEQFRDARYEA